MAGKLRFAAKLFLSTTVLAAGGAGMYYGTTVGWPAVQRLLAAAGTTGASANSPAAAERPAFADDDLDAVASVWAEPATAPITKPKDSSATARTADLAAARSELAMPAGDRYAVVDEDVSEDFEPTPAVAQELAEADDRAANLASEEPTPTPAVARGQEPPAGAATHEPAEPQAIVVTGHERNIGSSDSAARDAFASSPPVGGDNRYGAAPAQMREPATINPFSSSSTADAPTPARDTVEPLPALPHEANSELEELEYDGNFQPIENANRTARASRDASAETAHGPSPWEESAMPVAQPDDTPHGPATSPILGAAQSAGIEGAGKPGERALEGPQRPALEIQKFAPGEIQVGKPAKFVVQVRNVGTQPADGVTIRDEVPHGTRLISTTPAAQDSGGKITWELGKLSPGEDRTVEMQLMPTAEGEVGSVATVSYAAQASVKTRCTMPQLAIRMTAPSKVLVGQEQRIKIELRNPGSGDATGVMLFENVPQNVRHAAGPTLEFEIGTLRAGETRELELVLLADKAGKTVNVLSARADGNLQVQQQVEFEVIAPALAVDVNGPERRYLERPATYEVIVENPGTAPAHDVQIVTKLPKGMRFVRANNLGEYDAASHAVYWSLAELPEGERGTVELTAMPVETGAQTLQVESRASDGLTDQTQRQIVVDGLAAIMFELRDLEDPIEVGGETGYEIRVVNQGTKAATNLQVAVSLPPGMQVVSAEGETQHKAHRGGILFDPIPQLPAKSDTLYRVRVQGMQAGDQRVTVEVRTDDMAQPIRREESTRVFGDD
jgi:uncharacterized repeat protein (TIGR01451 family)